MHVSCSPIKIRSCDSLAAWSTRHRYRYSIVVERGDAYPGGSRVGHARVGLAVALICVLHWLWLCSPFSRPGVSCLFPWTRRDKRTLLYQEFKNLLHLQSPSTHRLSPLAGTVHGLGLLAVSGSVVGGIINYFGYFAGAPIPRSVLHGVSLSHIVFGYLLWVFVTGHVLMALQHWIAHSLRVVNPR